MPMSTTGMVRPEPRAFFAQARQSDSDTGFSPARAASEVRWIVAPSAIGSVKGTPGQWKSCLFVYDETCQLRTCDDARNVMQ